MPANVKATLLGPLRRLRSFLFSEAQTIGIEARDLAREARDVASDAHAMASETGSRLDALSGWLSDEVRQAKVYGGLRSLVERHPALKRSIGMAEARVFSQNGEDGILRFLLDRLGIDTGTFVEIGAERQEANCLLLALHQDWSGLFVDGDPGVAANLAELFRHSPQLRVVNELADPETIDDATERWGVPTEVDVLSIDVDGADYYLWEGLNRVRARIVVIEYNAALDPARPLVQLPTNSEWDGSVNFGCSVGALQRLARDKGYTLVYLESSGTNAFLVADEHLAGLGPMPEVRFRAPNYHLRPDGRHPGTVDESRFVDLDQAKPLA